MQTANPPLLFKKSPWPIFIAICIKAAILWLGSFIFSGNLQVKTYSFYWLSLLAVLFVFGILILALAMLPCFFYIKVNKNGLIIKRFHSITISWADIKNIRLQYNQFWLQSYLLFEYGNHFKIIRFPTIKKVHLYHFYLFLTKARALAIAGKIDFNLDLKNLLKNIKKEQKQDITQVYQWLQSRQVSHFSNHAFIMMGFSYSVLLAGMIVLNLAPIFNHINLSFIFSHLAYLSIYLIVLFTVALGIRKTVIYNINTHVLYTGISLLGKPTLLQQVMTDVESIDIKDTIWGKLHLYQVIFSNQSDQLPCRFFLTYSAAKRFKQRLARQLKLQTQDSYTSTYGIIMRLTMTIFDYISLAIFLAPLICLPLIYLAMWFFVMKR